VILVEWAIAILLAIGLFFNALGVIGILRFPDVYTRLHAETKTTTFGTIFIALGVIVWGVWQYMGSGAVGDVMITLHTIVAVLALAFTNATGAHAIARAAHRSGQVPVPAVVDRLSEAEE
jgi:multicomponent Na+:H+ antiporter subunit G